MARYESDTDHAARHLATEARHRARTVQALAQVDDDIKAQWADVDRLAAHPISPYRLTLHQPPTSRAQVEENRAQVCAMLRDPDTHQVRGPLTDWVDTDDGPVPGFCLLGAILAGVGGYFLHPYSDGLPEIELALDDLEEFMATILGTTHMRWHDLVHLNDHGTATFPDLARMIEDLPILVRY